MFIVESEITWLSPGDSIGRAFEWRGEIYRAIYKDSTDFVQKCFSSGLIERLVKTGLLVESVITELELMEFGLVIKHARCTVLPSADWSRMAFLDAAKLVIKINRELESEGLCTIDFHSHNIGFGLDSAPVWLDFSSIVPAPMSIDAAHREFSEYFLNPLRCFASSFATTKAARKLLQSGGCIKFSECAPFFSHEIMPSATSWSEYLTEVDGWLEQLECEMPAEKSQWSDYYSRANDICLSNFDLPTFEENPRLAILLDLLARYKPKKVVDLGCNAGMFSVYPERLGSAVIAMDYDENAVDSFYRILRAEGKGKQIVTMVRDLSDEATQSNKPIASEFVMALAVTHHLSLGQGLSFQRIAYLLTRYTENVLVTEFMPFGLGIDAPYPVQLPTWYTLENFCKAFSKYFYKVSIAKYEYKPGAGNRVFIICEGKKY